MCWPMRLAFGGRMFFKSLCCCFVFFETDRTRGKQDNVSCVKSDYDLLSRQVLQCSHGNIISFLSYFV